MANPNDKYFENERLAKERKANRIATKKLNERKQMMQYVRSKINREIEALYHVFNKQGHALNELDGITFDIQNDLKRTFYKDEFDYLTAISNLIALCKETYKRDIGLISIGD